MDDLKEGTKDENFKGRQVSIVGSVASVNIITTYDDESLDVIIEKALGIFEKIKKGN